MIRTFFILLKVFCLFFSAYPAQCRYLVFDDKEHDQSIFALSYLESLSLVLDQQMDESLLVEGVHFLGALEQKSPEFKRQLTTAYTTQIRQAGYDQYQKQLAASNWQGIGVIFGVAAWPLYSAIGFVFARVGSRMSLPSAFVGSILAALITGAGAEIMAEILNCSNLLHSPYSPPRFGSIVFADAQLLDTLL